MPTPFPASPHRPIRRDRLGGICAMLLIMAVVLGAAMAIPFTAPSDTVHGAAVGTR